VTDALFFAVTVPSFVVLLVLSAFFSGAETALTSMTKLRVKRLFSEGDVAYRKLESWLEEPNRYLVTILIGNNIVNVGASVLASAIFTRWLERAGWSHTAAFGGGLAFGTVTLLLLVFGEITPKTFAKQHDVLVAQRVIRPLDGLYRLLSPLIILFVGISNGIIRLFGGEKIKEVPLVTAEDVRTIIEVSEKEGLLEQEERDMIHSIIDFGDTLVREIMTPRVDIEALEISTPLPEVRQAVIQGGHSRIPVYEGDIDHVAGILHAKDLLEFWTDSHRQWALRDVLRPTFFIPKYKKVSDLLQTFRRERSHLAIVVDEYGCTTGLVTFEDVLEEIVGDIQDEYDQEPPESQVGESGEILADAKVDTDLLREEFNIDLSLPDSEFETLGGFIMTYLGDVPAVGDVIAYGSVKMTILEADDRRVKRVKIVRISPAEPEEPKSTEDGR
jgi:putative hemolysin